MFSERCGPQAQVSSTSTYTDGTKTTARCRADGSYRLGRPVIQVDMRVCHDATTVGGKGGGSVVDKKEAGLAMRDRG